MSLQVSWPEIEQRARTVLTDVGVHVRDVHMHFNHRLEIVVRIHQRSQAAKVIADELGSDFVVRYHEHPNAFPQDVVFVFHVSDVWPDEVFQRSNVARWRK